MCYLLSGVQGKQSLSNEEFQLINIMQVIVTNSSNSEYNDHSWAIAREYNNRVITDLDDAHKTWPSMGFCMHVVIIIINNNNNNK